MLAGSVRVVQVIPSVEEAAVVEFSATATYVLVVTGVLKLGLVKVGDVNVSPAIVVTVAPEPIDVEPIVGAENPDTVPQDEDVPSVVRYLPELPD